VADGGTDALPTNFVFTLTPGDTSARACVFGGMANVRSIGDPWWTGATGTMTSETFDGTFNTTKALTPMVVPGQRYFWGVEEFTDKAAGNVTWTDESMVFQIAWQ
jgi:hypothetical protein